MYCKYYQSLVKKNKTWFLTGCIKAEDNLVFFRTIDKNPSTPLPASSALRRAGRVSAVSLLEYFVTTEQEPKFLKLMNYFIKNEIVSELKELPNRIKIGI